MKRIPLVLAVTTALVLAPTAAHADEVPPEETPVVVEEPIAFEGDQGPIYPCDHPKAAASCVEGVEVKPTPPKPVPVIAPVRAPSETNPQQVPDPVKVPPRVKTGLAVGPKVGLV